MINVDKSITTSLIFSATGFSLTEPSLTIHSSYTNKTYTFILSEDESQSQHRFHKFSISPDMFNDCEEGFYIYSLINSEVVVKTGMLQVKSTTDDLIYTTIPTEDTDDDFIVYRNTEEEYVDSDYVDDGYL